ncbi:MAG: hypothetical protein M0R03_08125 [Novosphingobium sp.]|jgi:hypothetical protein|nr:hypothetical protein [Novosphingobium sp.]
MNKEMFAKLIEVAKKYDINNAFEKASKNENLEVATMEYVAEVAKELEDNKKTREWVDLGKDVAREFASTIIEDITMREQLLNLDVVFDVRRSDFGDEIKLIEKYPFNCTVVTPGGRSVRQERTVKEYTIPADQLDVMVSVPLRRILGGHESMSEIVAEMKMAIEAQSWILGLDAIYASLTSANKAGTTYTASTLRAAIDTAFRQMVNAGNSAKAIVGFEGTTSFFMEDSNFSDITKREVEVNGLIGQYKGKPIININPNIKNSVGGAFFSSTYLNRIFIIPQRGIYANLRGNAQLFEDYNIREQRYELNHFMDLGFLCMADEAYAIDVTI